MKTILLDTHVFLWLQNEPDRLSETMKRCLSSKEYRWFLSQIKEYPVQTFA